MPEEETRKLKGRLNRLKGQVEGLTKLVEGDDPVMVIVQMKAVIAAARGCLNEYGQSAVTSAQNEQIRQTLLKLMLTKGS